MRDRGGNVGIIFGLSFVPVVMMVGAGIDYGRLAAARGSLQRAADAAVLAVAKGIVSSTTDQLARSQAQVYLTTNYRNPTATVTSTTIATDRLSLCVTAQAQVVTSVMKIAGTSAMSTQVTSCAALQGGISPTDTYEIALVLDNSGSMSESTSGTTKIQALQSAATSFVNTMFTKAPGRVKFAITPFAGGVVAVDPNVSANRALSWIDLDGANSQHWVVFGGETAARAAGFTSRFDIFSKLKKRNSALDWRGCFEESAYPYNVRDLTISSTDPETLFVPYLAPDEPDPSGYSYYSNYGNDYLGDNGSGSNCSDTASGDWAKLTHVCKYKATSSLGGSFGPSAFFGPNQFCPDNSTQTVLQLTSTQTTVNSKIAQLSANGNTNLHAGFMWGWRTISPVGPFAQGRVYSASGNHKVIVFMTDGFNNWGTQTGTVVGSDYESLGYYTYNGAANTRLPDGSSGDGVNYRSALTASAGSYSSYLSTSRSAEDDLTLEACANAKAAGIEIFTIGFSIPNDPIDAQGLTLLKNCATNASHYFAATDAASLNLAFSTIGTGLGSLRLTQ
ncbi:TadE/TadG family type IV pilus assembly protein [Methylosinus sp. LW4]|uniref:TadE/TadG family type IV pilus assembly protein n=1 Tax=Methylosinus sp. LW4 TaxID=136993 RepID=UPI0003646F01|nr:TadE/TadG family type IV pilus assembly protein [Methylosinus sp. LW4]